MTQETKPEQRLIDTFRDLINFAESASFYIKPMMAVPTPWYVGFLKMIETSKRVLDVSSSQETKPERQSAEEIINDILCLGGTNFKQRLIDALQSERSISDKLREENEELTRFAQEQTNNMEEYAKKANLLQKRVDSEYNRGIEDAASKCNSCHDCNNPESGFGNNACCSSDRSKAILKLRRG